MPPRRMTTQPPAHPSGGNHPSLTRKPTQPAPTRNANTVARSGRSIKPTERIVATRADEEEAIALRQKKTQRKEDRHAKQRRRATDLEEEEEALASNAPRTSAGQDDDMFVTQVVSRRKNALAQRAPLVPRTNTPAHSSPPANNSISSPPRTYPISTTAPRQVAQRERHDGLNKPDASNEGSDNDDVDDIDPGDDDSQTDGNDTNDEQTRAYDDQEGLDDHGHRAQKRSSPDGDSDEGVIAPKRAKRNSSDSSKARLRESDLLPDALSILKTAQATYRSKVSTEWPYPNTGEDIAFAKAAWMGACEAAGEHYEYDTATARNIMERGSQVRGELKNNARKFGESLYGIIGLQGNKRRLRELVEDLLNQGAFGYKDYSARKGLYQHAAIQALINYTWFRNSTDNGAVCETLFNPDDEGIPLVTIAIVLTAIENVLDEWQTGEHNDLIFSEIAYRQKFEDHLRTLQNFEDRPGGKVFLLKLRRKMYRQARVHAKVPTDHRVTTTTVYTDNDFNAALLEGVSDGEDDE